MLKDNRGYEIAGDDKKYIYTNKSAFTSTRERMKGNNGEYGNGTQAIDVSPVVGR